MHHATRFGRYLALVFLCLLALRAPAVPAHAQATVPPSADVRFRGQVVTLLGPQDNPTGFRLQASSRLIEFRLANRTAFQPASAEAEVEGFSVGDYAQVYARRVDHAWVAYRIQFDVQPLINNQVTLSGTVLRVTGNGRHFVLRLASGQTRAILITARTRFHIDGQPADGPPDLLVHDVVQVVARRSGRSLIALDVNLRTQSAAAP